MFVLGFKLAMNNDKIIVCQLITILCFLSAPSSAMYRNFDLAYRHAKIIYDNQHIMKTEEIILRLMAIKTDLTSIIFQKIPWKMAPNIDRALIINTIALMRLVEVSNEKCYQPAPKIHTGNVHQSNYINLEIVTKESFLSETMQNLIKSHSDAQHQLCILNLILNMSRTWARTKKAFVNAERFQKSLVSEFPLDKSMSDLTEREKIDGLSRFMQQFYEINLEINDEVVKTYNKSFRGDCNLYALEHFQTLMSTYEKTGRTRNNVERHHGNLVRMYDLCNDLPDKIEMVEDIGKSTIKIAPPTKAAQAYNRGAGDSNIPFATDPEMLLLPGDIRRRIYKKRNSGKMDPIILETSNPDSAPNTRKKKRAKRVIIPKVIPSFDPKVDPNISKKSLQKEDKKAAKTSPTTLIFNSLPSPEKSSSSSSATF